MAYDYESVKIQGELTHRKINDSVAKLINNDNQMIYGNVSPSIWECVWYGMTKEKAVSYGYSKGDAVWLNTQSMDDFVNSRKNDIISYAKLYQRTNLDYEQVMDDTEKVLEFCKTLVDGNNSYDDYHKHVFYIGTLSCQTQIRISKCDNNIYLPTDDDHWEDFIRRDYNQDYYTDIVMEKLDEQEEWKLNSHLVNYHLSGLIGNNTEYKTPIQFADMYLDKSLSNQDATNRFASHKYTSTLSGFDYIVEFYEKEYSNGGKKWYKKWKSGLLEHGGIVVVDSDNMIEEDSLEYGGTCYQVSLLWKVGDTATSPIYDYPAISLGTFYMRDNKIDDGYQNEYRYDSQESQVDWDCRYQVSITPLHEDDVELECPYYFATGSTTPHYTTREVTNMTNYSFRFRYSQNFTKYSYYTRGFVRNG